MAPSVETNGRRVATASSPSGCLRDEAEDFTGGGGRVLLFFAISVSYRMHGIHVPYLGFGIRTSFLPEELLDDPIDLRCGDWLF